MELSLTPESEALIRERVESGVYASASEVVQDGLRLLAERDAIQESRYRDLREDVRAGFEQTERGEFNEYTSVDEPSLKILAKPPVEASDSNAAA